MGKLRVLPFGGRWISWLACVLTCLLAFCVLAIGLVGLLVYLPISRSAYFVVVGYAICVANHLFYINIGIWAAL